MFEGGVKSVTPVTYLGYTSPGGGDAPCAGYGCRGERRQVIRVAGAPGMSSWLS